MAELYDFGAWQRGRPAEREMKISALALPGGSGGGTSGGMEARIAKLEASVSHLERDMGEVRADTRSLRDSATDTRERLTRLEERVAHLPGKGFIVTCTTITLGIIVAIVTAAPKLQALLGVTAP